MNIYCCACEKDVDAKLVSGKEIYKHRKDLYSLPFWQCETCDNFVGCHHKTKQKTAPLGCIPTPELKEVRKKIHATLDPLWMDGNYKRKDLYAKLSEKLGRQYHTAELKNVTEANLILNELKALTIKDIV